MKLGKACVGPRPRCPTIVYPVLCKIPFRRPENSSLRLLVFRIRSRRHDRVPVRRWNSEVGGLEAIALRNRALRARVQRGSLPHVRPIDCTIRTRAGFLRCLAHEVFHMVDLLAHAVLPGGAGDLTLPKTEVVFGRVAVGPRPLGFAQLDCLLDMHLLHRRSRHPERVCADLPLRGLVCLLGVHHGEASLRLAHVSVIAKSILRGGSEAPACRWVLLRFECPWQLVEAKRGVVALQLRGFESRVFWEGKVRFRAR